MAGKPVLQAPIAPFRSASDAGWGGEGSGAHAQDADKEPATRPQRTAGSQTSFSAVWGGEGNGAHAQDADKEPATRPQRTAGSKTSFSAVSRASFLVSQKGITSRARPVSSRAGTGHVLEVGSDIE
jgi:hypothetical protein